MSYGTLQASVVIPKWKSPLTEKRLESERKLRRMDVWADWDELTVKHSANGTRKKGRTTQETR